MTVTYGASIIKGLAADTKPTNVPADTIFIEKDTGNVFDYDGAVWINRRANLTDYTFLVYPLGSLDYRVKRGSDGAIVYTSNNASVRDAIGAFNFCRDGMAAVALANSSSPGTICKINQGYYPISTSLVFNDADHRFQTWQSNSGWGLQSDAHIRIEANAPAILIDGSTENIIDIALSGLYISHFQDTYTTGLIKILNFVVGAKIEKCFLTDFVKNKGDGILFEITDNTKSQYKNRVIKTDHRHQENFIRCNHTVTSSASSGFSTSTEIDGCYSWLSKRMLKVEGVSGAQNLDWHWRDCVYQHDPSNTVAAGQGIFDYDSSVSCWQQKHTDCMIWDITTPGINYANVGGSVELMLRGCNPSSRIGGSGAHLNKVKVDEYYLSNQSTHIGLFRCSYTVAPFGEGALLGLGAITTPVNQRNDTTSPYLEFPTGTTPDSSAGVRKGPTMFRTDQNPYFEWMGNNNSTTVSRLYCGWHSTSPIPGTDTPLGSADHGILIGYRSTDTNYTIFHNDGASAMATIDTGIPKSTVVSTKFVIMAGPTSFTWVVNGTVSAPVTTKLPGSTTPLMPHLLGQNTTSTSVNYNLRYAKLILRNT